MPHQSPDRQRGARFANAEKCDHSDGNGIPARRCASHPGSAPFEMSGVAGCGINQPPVDRGADAPQRPRGCRYLECRQLHEPYILLRGGVRCLDTAGLLSRHRGTETQRHARRKAFLCGLRQSARWQPSTSRRRHVPARWPLPRPTTSMAARDSVLRISSCLRASSSLRALHQRADRQDGEKPVEARHAYERDAAPERRPKRGRQQARVQIQEM